MKLEKRLFGELEGRPVYEILMENSAGMQASVLTYGGIIKSIRVPDKKGGLTDVVLGHDVLQGGYVGTTPAGIGMLLGRNANRIKPASYELDGVLYELEQNEFHNNLHGGSGNYGMKLFEAKLSQEGQSAFVSLCLKDTGEGGFPGTVDVCVTYELTEENAFIIHYEAVPSEDTVLNLSNHVYFNMSGHASGSIDDNMLCLEADFYTPNDDEGVPTGEVRSVEGTPFDFRTFRRIGDGMYSDHGQIQLFGGFDHNICLRGRGYRKVLTVYAEDTGCCMEIRTDRPGAQFYSSNHPVPDVPFKDGARYKLHQGFAFETQHIPNAPNFSHFPCSVIRKGQVFRSKTGYYFSVKA